MKKILLKIIYNILAFFTRIYLKRTNPYVIWITWSVWKTSCRTIIYHILKKYETKRIVYTSPKNFNSELWMIFSIFKIETFTPWIFSLFKKSLIIIWKSIFCKKQYDIIILEYWIDHPLDMDFLLSIVKPNISIFTKLDTIHIENFSSKEQIWEEKFKLIQNTKDKIYLNYEDEFQKNKYESIKINKDFFNKKIIKSEYIKEREKLYSKIFLKKKTVKTNILWTENFLYIDLAFMILDDLWINYEKREDTISLDLQKWRFNIFTWINSAVLIDSTYNAWPESMKKMIENTYDIREKLFPDYKLWFVVWDMRELWNFSKEDHIKLSRLFETNDLLITVWKETKKYFSKEIKNFTFSKDAWVYLKNILLKSNQKYIILFKGSQNTIFIEEALKQVLLNGEDKNNLVRQEKIWLEKKNK